MQSSDIVGGWTEEAATGVAVWSELKALVCCKRNSGRPFGSFSIYRETKQRSSWRSTKQGEKNVKRERRKNEVKWPNAVSLKFFLCVNSARQRNSAKTLEHRSREDYCVISPLEFTNDHSEIL